MGNWLIKRKVCTSQNRLLAQMEGVGVFTYFDMKELLYKEQLINHTKNSKTFFARKAYRYRFLNESVYIYFHEEENGRLFLTLQDVKGNMEGSAWCGLDYYQALWQWSSNHSFQIKYQIKGTKKDYFIESRFEKCR